MTSILDWSFICYCFLYGTNIVLLIKFVNGKKGFFQKIFGFAAGDTGNLPRLKFVSLLFKRCYIKAGPLAYETKKYQFRVKNMTPPDEECFLAAGIVYFGLYEGDFKVFNLLAKKREVCRIIWFC